MPKSAVWNECQEETIKQYDDVGNVKEKTDSRAVWHTPDNAVMMIKTMRLMNKEKGKQGRLKRFTDDNEMVENNSVPLSKCQCVCVRFCDPLSDVHYDDDSHGHNNKPNLWGHATQ